MLFNIFLKQNRSNANPLVEERRVFKIKTWLENLLMVSRLTQASHLGNAQKDKDFLIVLLQKFEINMVFILSNYKRCQTVLKLKKKVQESAAESCTSILFLKNFVILKTMKLKSSTIINTLLGLSIYISKYKGEADKKFKYTKHDKFAKKALIFGNLQLWQKVSTSYL